jgi:hypothetical protein
MVMTLMIPIFSFMQSCFGPLWSTLCPVYPALNGRTGQLFENNWIFLLEHLDKVPRAPISPNRGMPHCPVNLTPDERAEPVVVHSITRLVFSRSSFVFLLLADTFFLCAFGARQLCDALFVTF